MSAQKLSFRVQYEIWKELQETGAPKDVRYRLAKEYGVSETLIRRIGKKEGGELRNLGCVTESPDSDGKPRVKVKAISVRIEGDQHKSLTRLKNAVALSEIDASAGILDVITSSSGSYLSLAPIGKRIEPVGLARKYGSLESVTADGAFIQHNSSGTPVKVLRCPVYNHKWMMVTRQDVDIVSVDGVSVKGRTTNWSGEKISGSLFFEGVKGSGIVSRVEFHPDTTPKRLQVEQQKLVEKLL